MRGAGDASSFILPPPGYWAPLGGPPAAPSARSDAATTSDRAVAGSSLEGSRRLEIVVAMDAAFRMMRPVLALTVDLRNLYSNISNAMVLPRSYSHVRRHVKRVAARPAKDTTPRRSTTTLVADAIEVQSGTSDDSSNDSWADGPRPPTPPRPSMSLSASSAVSPEVTGATPQKSLRPTISSVARHTDPMLSLISLVGGPAYTSSNSFPHRTPTVTTTFPRALTQPSDLVTKQHSDGQWYQVDNANGDLVLFVGMMLCERYEVIRLLGAGAFGQVALCRDLVAVAHNIEVSIDDTHTPMPSSRRSSTLGLSTLQRASLSRRASTIVPHRPPVDTPSDVFGGSQIAGTTGAAAKNNSSNNTRDTTPKMMPETVAVKVIKSDAAYERQTALEVNVVRDMMSKFPNDPRCQYVVRNFGHGYSYGHYCIVFELLGASLYDVLEANKFAGMSVASVREVAFQLLSAISLCVDAGFTHSDVKPENVLLTRHADKGALPRLTSTLVSDTSRNEAAMNGSTMAIPSLDEQTTPICIRLIDFGAAFRTGSCPFTYIQSRYYRAPEVILDGPLTAAMDVWSVGCLLAELFLGLPLFPGGDDYQQLQLMQEMLGPMPAELLETGRCTGAFFENIGAPDPGSPGSDEHLNASGTTAGGRGNYHGSSNDSTNANNAVLPTPSRFRDADNFYNTYHTLSRPGAIQRYFNYTTLPALVNNYPLSSVEREWVARVQDATAAREARLGLPPSGGRGGMDPLAVAAIINDRNQLCALLTALLTYDPAQRPTAADALKHAFFTAGAGLPDPRDVAERIVAASHAAH
jgi:serine/threonine protein kinase